MRKLIGLCKCGTELRHAGSIACRKCYIEQTVKNLSPRRTQLLTAQYKYKMTPKGKFKGLREGAAKRDLEVTLTLEEYAAIIASNTCIYCSSSLPKYGHGLDRKNNVQGYTKENSVPCCSSCNSIKSDRIYFEEMLWIMARRKYLGIL